MRRLIIALIAAGVLYAEDPMSEAIRLARAHRYKEAAEAIAKASPPQDRAQLITYHRVKAAIALGNGDAAASASQMNAALKLAPQDHNLAQATAMAESQAGDAAEKSGDSLAAVSFYKAAVEHAPAVEQYRLDLGLELLRHQTFDAAVVVFEAAVKAFPDSERAKVALGVSYYLADHPSNAITALLSAGSTSELAAAYLGQILLESPESPGTAAVQRVCAFSTPHLQALCGGLLAKTGDTAGALRRLEAAARSAPDDATARCEFGKALDTARKWTEAKTELEACVQLDPGSPVSHYRLARVYQRLGLDELAKQQQAAQREAEQKLGAENDRRNAVATRFLYTLGAR